MSKIKPIAIHNMCGTFFMICMMYVPTLFMMTIDYEYLDFELSIFELHCISSR